MQQEMNSFFVFQIELQYSKGDLTAPYSATSDSQSFPLQS